MEEAVAANVEKTQERGTLLPEGTGQWTVGSRGAGKRIYFRFNTH